MHKSLAQAKKRRKRKNPNTRRRNLNTRRKRRRRQKSLSTRKRRRKCLKRTKKKWRRLRRRTKVHRLLSSPQSPAIDDRQNSPDPPRLVSRLLGVRRALMTPPDGHRGTVIATVRKRAGLLSPGVCIRETCKTVMTSSKPQISQSAP
jgi:hypothetical protein